MKLFDFHILVAVGLAAFIPSTLVNCSADAESKPEADAEAKPESKADADASAEPAAYSFGHGKYSGYYGMNMGPTYVGPLAYGTYGYKSYGYGGKAYRYKREADAVAGGYSSYGGRYSGYYGANSGPTHYGRQVTPHYGGYGTLGGYGGRYRRYKRMSETEADAGYDAYGYGYDSFGLGYGYREYGYGLYGYPLVGGYHFGPIISKYDLLFAGLKNVYKA